MSAPFNRVKSAIKPCWVATVALLFSLTLATARDIHSLDDYEIFRRTAGNWEGVGVSFDIAPNGALQPAVTFRDTWEATISEGARLMVMNGVTQAGGRRVEYVWRFRWEADVEKVTAEFENSLGVSSTMEATVVADGKRLELRAPREESKAGEAPVSEDAGLRLDIYLEGDDDLVIEVVIRAADGSERYRSAARYRKSAKASGKRSKVGLKPQRD